MALTGSTLMLRQFVSMPTRQEASRERNHVDRVIEGIPRNEVPIKQAANGGLYRRSGSQALRIGEIRRDSRHMRDSVRSSIKSLIMVVRYATLLRALDSSAPSHARPEMNDVLAKVSTKKVPIIKCYGLIKNSDDHDIATICSGAQCSSIPSNKQYAEMHRHSSLVLSGQCFRYET